MTLNYHNRILFFSLVLACFVGPTAAGVVVVVSSKSSVTILSKNQIADIFLGKASRFPNGEFAAAIDLADGSSTRKEFYEVFAGKSPTELKAHWSKIIFTGRGRPPPTVLNGSEMKQKLQDNLRAIGYLEESEVDNSVRKVTLP